MKPLPVPPLNDTLERTLGCVDAVIDDAAPTHRLAHDFAVGAGPRIQKALENYAAGQWDCLRGGIRVPGEDRDSVEHGPRTAADREIVVFCAGRAFVLPVSDAEGRVAPRAELAAGFTRILEAAGGSAPDGAGEGPGFTDASYRGSGDDEFRAWLTEPANTDVHERLARALFCVSVPAVAGASTAGVGDEPPGCAPVPLHRGTTGRISR
ncbi:choline/carnitine O-acyltransferase [Corynebacterium frankenforstense]